VHSHERLLAFRLHFMDQVNASFDRSVVRLSGPPQAVLI